MSEESEFLAKVRREFLQEASDLIDECEEALLNIDGSPSRDNLLAEVFRGIHTIKGSGAAVGFVNLVEFAHEFEDCLAALRTYPDQLHVELISLLLNGLDALRAKVSRLAEGRHDAEPDGELIQQFRTARATILNRPVTDRPPSRQGFEIFDDKETVDQEKREPPAAHPVDDGLLVKRDSGSFKVDSGRIDSVLDLVGELMVLRSQLINKTEPYAYDAALTAVVALLDKTVRELQGKALAIRMTPIKPLFMKMQRMARDLSIKIGKEVDFELEGEETELDRMVVEALSDPLMHLVRNAIDHGIEGAKERTKCGKGEKGQLRLMASQSSGRILVRIVDDGRGIRRDLVVKKAIEKGLLKPDVPVETLPDSEIFALLLMPGFSTADRVTDISGRGVGLDVVKNQIAKLKGSLLIKSEEGQGSVFEISLPLTTSVTDGMIVQVAGQLLVLPMDGIRELVKIEEENLIEMEGDRQVLHVRGQVFPVVCPKALLPHHHRREADEPASLAVILEHQDRLYALGIVSVVGQMQVITKPLHAAFPRHVIAGVTILGDGHVALVADIGGLIESCLGDSRTKQGERMAL